MGLRMGRLLLLRWVADQLRRHAARSTMSFADLLLDDRDLATSDPSFDGDDLERDAVAERMERSARW